MARSISDGGYDTWGVRGPDGWIREFSTQDKAERFATRMEGQNVFQHDGTVAHWTGLSVVHRYIPEWTEIPIRNQVITE